MTSVIVVMDKRASKEESKKMEQQEKYVGGVSSIFWRREGLRGGYMIVATTKRLIGVKLADLAAQSKRRSDFEKAPVTDGKKTYFNMTSPGPQVLSEEQTRSLIQYLLKVKDFEVSKEDIEKIRLHSPGRFRGGNLKIQGKTIGEIEIKMFSEPAIGPTRGMHMQTENLFEQISNLMQTFYPEVLELEN
jgi:hypothetical protein